MDNFGKKILVVDDTESTRYAICRTLQSSGYKVVTAANGKEALSLIGLEKPDLVTLDIHLPDISGFEVCRQIKQQSKTAHIPVLQISASFVASKDRIHGLEGGADSYLTHPFEPTVLVATIKSLLRTRHLHENLRISEDRFRVALKYAPISIYTMDTNLQYTWMCNPPGGLTNQDFIGKTDFDLLPFEQASEITKFKKEVIESSTGQRLIIWLHFNKTVRCYDVTIEPLKSSEGEVGGLNIAAIDITDRMNAEAAQKAAFEEAELANRAKSRFLANMSHEIRTPLGVIQGFADLALDPSISLSDRNEYLVTIKRNADSLTKLIGDILDLSKIEANRIEIEKTRFSVMDLMAEVIATMQLQAKEKNIDLQYFIQSPLPEYIKTDSTRLRQVLINLISNALKFTQQGHVHIKVSTKSKVLAKDSVTLEFIIEDTGIGLTLEQQGRLFEAFMQADSSTTRKFGGTGLGLNLSKKLVQTLGGDLMLTSSVVGQGSIFTFYLDVGISGEELVKSPSQEIKNLLGLKVLVVEDSLDNQILFSRYLKNAGVHVDLAIDGLEGVSMARKNTYDAILMDIQMPNLDGYAATKLLRAEGKKIPIIALTAHALKEEREHALANGFTSYLTKPLNQNDLVNALAVYF